MVRAPVAFYPSRVHAQPRNHPEPLSPRAEAARLALASLLSVLLLAGASTGHGDRPPLWLDIGLGVVALAIVHWRRRWPLLVAVLTTLTSVVSITAAGPAILATVSLATRRRYVEWAVLAVVSVGASAVFDRLYPSGAVWWASLAWSTISTAALIAIGAYMGARRDLHTNLRERAETAERERDTQAERAREAERARIAREMHDVLAHRISLVAMHAGPLSYRDDLTRDEMRDAAHLVQRSANMALHELRQVLGVLRDEASTGHVVPPQPTLADLDALVAEARAGGMRVDLHREGELGDVPDTVGRGAYRVVQEALTNARKHAPGARVDGWGVRATASRSTSATPSPWGPAWGLRATCPARAWGWWGWPSAPSCWEGASITPSTTAGST